MTRPSFCGRGGGITGSTPLPAGHLADFAVGENLVALSVGEHLRAMDYGGRPLWMVSGSFAGVLLLGEHVFAPDRDVPVVHQIDARSGGMVRILGRGPDG